MKITRMLSSSLGKKIIVAVTGIFLCLFLIVHLYGNFLLYHQDGGKAFNEYSHSLVNSIFIRITEVVLFAAIIIHVIMTLILTIQNRKARSVKYVVDKRNQTSSWFSRNMGLTGSVILIFLVVHLNTFFVSYRITGTSEENLALHVQQAFESRWYSAFYVFASTFLAFHLYHGFKSAFDTMGFTVSKRVSSSIKYMGIGFALLMGLGYASFPILFYFKIISLN